MTSPDPLADALERVSVAVVRPGDTLLIAPGRALSLAEIDEWATHLQAVMPDGVKFAVFEDDVRVTVVRPEQDV